MHQQHIHQRPFNPVDQITIAYLFITSAYMAIATNITPLPNISEYLLIRVGILLAVLGFIALDFRWPNVYTAALHHLYPLLFLAYLYGNTHVVNHVIFNNLDYYFAAADQWLFGFQPSILFQKNFPYIWLNELMYFGYLSYYVINVGLSIYLYVKHRAVFNRLFFILICSFYGYYLFYSLVPVVGPQYYFAYPLGHSNVGYVFGPIMKFIQAVGEHPTGAFPSSHVGASLLLLYLAFKTSKAIFYVLLPVVSCLMLATVYIKAHYFVDILGGMLFCGVLYYLSNAFYQKLNTP